MNIFGGYEDFVDIFLGSSKNWASLRVISMQLGSFFKVKVQNWDIFLGRYNFKYFFGVLEIPDIFGANGRCWVRAYVCRKIRVPPLGLVHLPTLFAPCKLLVHKYDVVRSKSG